MHLDGPARPSARFVETGREAHMLAYLSDAIARVVIPGLSSTLLVTSPTTALRSAAVLVLLFRAV